MKQLDTSPDPTAPFPKTDSADRKKKEFLPLVILFVSLLFFAVKAVTSMVQESSTWDETHYFGVGKYLMKHQRWDVPDSILHPPLSYYAHSLPLLFFKTDDQIWNDSAKNPNRGSMDILRGQALLSDPLNEGDRLLNLSRLMMVLTAVLLGWFVFSWSYELYGKWSAILAIILFCFCPNILAHARLITPDILLTTFTFITVYYWWRLLRENRQRDAIAGGLCLGLALLSKFTAILLLPICFTLLAVWRTKQKTLHWKGYVIFGAIGFTVLLFGYGFNLEPFFSGIAFQRSHAQGGHWAFLFGEYSQTGWSKFFVLAFLIKTTIPTLIFLTIAAVLYFGKIRKRLGIDELFLLVPTLVVFGVFTAQGQNTGLRYILPVFPFLIIFASDAARCFLRTKMLTGLCILFVAWHIGASSRVHPHYLAYFNELAGGPSNGYKYLVDSNLDWGQDLKGLKKFMQERGIEKIHLSYFGTDSPQRYGIDYSWMPSFVLLNPEPEKEFTMPKGWVAISATNLQGLYLRNKDLYAEFRKRKPVAVIGYSIFVYNTDEPTKS